MASRSGAMDGTAPGCLEWTISVVVMRLGSFRATPCSQTYLYGIKPSTRATTGLNPANSHSGYSQVRCLPVTVAPAAAARRRAGRNATTQTVGDLNSGCPPVTCVNNAGGRSSPPPRSRSAARLEKPSARRCLAPIHPPTNDPMAINPAAGQPGRRPPGCRRSRHDIDQQRQQVLAAFIRCTSSGSKAP